MRGLNLDKANNSIWATVREYILHSKKLREAIEAQKDTSYVDRVGLEAELNSIRKKVDDKDQEINDLLRRKGRYRNISDNQIDEVVGEIKSEKGNLQIAQQELMGKLAKLDSIEDRGKQIEKFLFTLSDRVDNLSDQERSDVLQAIIGRVNVSFNDKTRQHHLDICLAIEDDAQSGAVSPRLAAYPISN